MDDAPNTDPPPHRRTLSRLALRLILCAAFILALHLLIDWALERAAASASAEMLTAGLIAVLVLAYALLIAVPFVPGIEIGLALLALRGSEVAPIVYVATIAGLMLAFGAGRQVPLDRLQRWFHDLRLTRAAAFVQRIAPLSPPRRLGLIRSHLPAWIAP